jgi:hypothetical protein
MARCRALTFAARSREGSPFCSKNYGTHALCSVCARGSSENFSDASRVDHEMSIFIFTSAEIFPASERTAASRAGE